MNRDPRYLGKFKIGLLLVCLEGFAEDSSLLNIEGKRTANVCCDFARDLIVYFCIRKIECRSALISNVLCSGSPGIESRHPQGPPMPALEFSADFDEKADTNKGKNTLFSLYKKSDDAKNVGNFTTCLPKYARSTARAKLLLLLNGISQN